MPVAFARQTDKPLFPDIFWNRPTLRSRGGRLLIVGGQTNAFNEVQAIYQTAEAAGIGECQAVLPDSLRRVIGESGFAQFLPSSPSGSLGQGGLGELLHIAETYDAVIIGANLTNNAETAVLIEGFMRQYQGRIIITEEAIGVLKLNAGLIGRNSQILVVASMAGLLTLANNLHVPVSVNRHAGVLEKLAVLETLASETKCSFVISDGALMVAAEGKLSITTHAKPLGRLMGGVVGVAATMWVQQPAKPFASLTTAAFVTTQAATATASYSELAECIASVLRQYEF